MPSDYDAEKERQSEILFTRPWQRALFLTGLFGCVALLFVALLVRF